MGRPPPRSAYTADGDASLSSRLNLQTGAILAPTWRAPWPELQTCPLESPGSDPCTYLEGAVAGIQTCPLESPGRPAHAGCAPGVTHVSSTTNRMWRSPSRLEWSRPRQSRVYCMGEVGGPFARKITPNSVPYTTGSCFASSGHNARGQTSYNRALEITEYTTIEHGDNLAHEKTFCARGVRPNERKAVANANRGRKP